MQIRQYLFLFSLWLILLADPAQPWWFVAISTVLLMLIGFIWHKRQHHPDDSPATQMLPISLAVMSHELRTPLASQLSIMRVLRNTPLDEMQRQLVEAMDHSSDVLMSLLNNTLDYYCLADDQLEIERGNFNLRALLKDLSELMEGAAKAKGIIFTCVIDEAVPDIVYGDASRIRQILMNLLNNAIKFTDSGIVKLQIEAGAAVVGYDAVQFTVIDTGIGMSDDVQQQIFSPFCQGQHIQQRYGGSGLGLNISLALARKMDGNIAVESREGVGSCFHFCLPLPVVHAAVHAGADVPKIKESQLLAVEDVGKLNILIVDDAAINRVAAKAVMESAGHTVSLASSAEEALFRMQEQRFDGVLMDMQLPGMDGLSAIRRIRKWHDAGPARLVIIAWSAWMPEEQRRQLLAGGADAFCLKPIDLDVLHAAFMRRVQGKGRYLAQCG